MTQITIWLDRDRQDEQFVFYDLCQHMNSSKDICQKRQPLLGPYLKGQPLFLGIDRKVLSFPTSFLQQVITNSSPFSRHFRKKLLGADPVTP